MEPTITALNVGTGNMVSENEMGVFVIRNDGDRSMTVERLRFEVSGAWDFPGNFGPKNFKLDRADPTTGARIANTLRNGSPINAVQLNGLNANDIVSSGSVLEVNIAAVMHEEIAARSSKAYVLLADTTQIKNTSISSSASTQVRMLGQKASPVSTFTDGLVWSYTRTATGQQSGALTISDSYIVPGKNLLY